MIQQAAGAILMIEPTSFGYNTETSIDNFFQKKSGVNNFAEQKNKAINEFYAFVKKLKEAGISVFIKRHDPGLSIPDAVFPNNWISFLPDGTVVIFPMLALNRRLEKEVGLISEIARTTGYVIKKVIDLSYFESDAMYLEGTGSIVFDHENKTAFACISPRTSLKPLELLCAEINYAPFVFHATDALNRPVYHTNVLLTITSALVIVCLDCVKDDLEKAALLEKFKNTGRQIVLIDISQMEAFAGNMLELVNNNSESFLIMSETARNSLSPGQLNLLQKHHQVMVVTIPTIELIGGGSARCMMAEVFI